MAGRPPLPEMSETATRATGDGFNSVSIPRKDKHDDAFYHSC